MDSNTKRAVKNFFMRPRNILISVLGLIVLIGIIISVYYLFIYSFMCADVYYANHVYDIPNAMAC